MRRLLTYTITITSVLCFSCRQRYLPPAIETDMSYLVVDGVLINGADPTIIRLSRTRRLNDNLATAGEKNADMFVEDSDGNNIYQFVSMDANGNYIVQEMHLDTDKKYRLHIRTTDGNEYISDDIPVKITPPIDSINWQRNNDGVTIYANTHDAQHNTGYYRWEYMETWDYYTDYYSKVTYEKDAPDYIDMFPPRKIDASINRCWKTVYSSQVLLAKTVLLSEDKVSLYPLRFIPANAFELNSVYTILVKQYAISEKAFDYFENLKKITELTGSVFDILPSELNGNIHCVNNAGALAIGFISGSTLQQQRIFIKKLDVLPWHFFYPCEPVRVVPLDDDSIEYYFGGRVPKLIPIDQLWNPAYSGVTAGSPLCTDCTTWKGVNVKPDFWP